MNSRERIHLAMCHEIPDRVPVMCQLALGHYFLHGQTNPADVWFDSDTLVDTLTTFQHRYRFDGFLVNLPGRPANWQDYLTERCDDGGEELLTWQSGHTSRFVSDDNPHTFQGNDQPLPRAGYADVDPDDPATYRVSGYVWNTWHAPHLWDIPDDADLTRSDAYPEWYTRPLRRARQRCPDVSVHAEVFSPFTHLMELFGCQNALLALLDAPETCHQLLRVFTKMAIAQVRCYAPCDPDAILISSAFAGAGFISRQMYAEFVLPYEQQVAHTTCELRIPAYTHTCGAIGDRLDLMADTGIDGIDTLDPPPLGTVDLARAKADFGDRLFFKGNLDAVNEMLNADGETFRQAVLQRLKIGKPGSGYILSSACSVSPYVRPARLETMVTLAEQYGQYV